jgi:ribosomal protein S18 acetylase RimI-like enzyme
LSQVFKIRIFDRKDYQSVIRLISDVIVNEFRFKLEFDSLDSDLLQIEKHYNKADGGSFWVAERSTGNNSHSQIVGTIAIRNLKQLESTCELKRMYVLKEFRRLGIGQRMLDIATDFARRMGYSRIVLDSSKRLDAARALYLKAGFVDIPRYNDNYRADVFMERRLLI